MRALGVGSTQRMEAAPNVPTMAETLPGLQSLSWHGLFAPAAVPPAIVTRLNAEALKAVNSPDLAARFGEPGITAGTWSPTEFAAFVASETRRWGDVARKANIRASRAKIGALPRTPPGDSAPWTDFNGTSYRATSRLIGHAYGGSRNQQLVGLIARP